MPQRENVFAAQVVAALKAPKPEIVPEASRIDVHAAVSRFAVLYERIRNAVDYKDEHLLRKAAINRILQRQLILERNPDAVALNLVRELVGARYLPNGEMPESIIDQVAIRIRKFQAVVGMGVGSSAHFTWLRAVLAVELEDVLVDSTREKALVTFLYERLADRIAIRGAELSDTDLHLQIYLACHRTFLKSDDDTLSFKLLRAYLPEWLRPDEWVENPRAMAERLIGVRERIRTSLANRYAQKIQRLVKPWAVALEILVEALQEKPEEMQALLANPDALHGAVTRLAEKRYRTARAKLRRGAVRAIIYIFLTKMLVALVIEVPLERLLYREVSLTALGINLMFPPFMMFLVALFIRVPGKDNTARMRSNVDAILSEEGIPMREIRIRKTTGPFGTFLFSMAYASVYLLIFGGILLLLLGFKFTGVAAAIFIFFLCTVSFFAFRLRQNAREQVVVEGRDSLRSLIIDLISLPILRAGHFLAHGISRLNVFLFFFDFLLEAPFKIFLTVLEEWFAFLKEKKEELQ